MMGIRILNIFSPRKQAPISPQMKPLVADKLIAKVSKVLGTKDKKCVLSQRKILLSQFSAASLTLQAALSNQLLRLDTFLVEDAILNGGKTPGDFNEIRALLLTEIAYPTPHMARVLPLLFQIELSDRFPNIAVSAWPISFYNPVNFYQSDTVVFNISLGSPDQTKYAVSASLSTEPGSEELHVAFEGEPQGMGWTSFVDRVVSETMDISPLIHFDLVIPASRGFNISYSKPKSKPAKCIQQIVVAEAAQTPIIIAPLEIDLVSSVVSEPGVAEESMASADVIPLTADLWCETITNCMKTIRDCANKLNETKTDLEQVPLLHEATQATLTWIRMAMRLPELAEEINFKEKTGDEWVVSQAAQARVFETSRMLYSAKDIKINDTLHREGFDICVGFYEALKSDFRGNSPLNGKPFEEKFIENIAEILCYLEVKRDCLHHARIDYERYKLPDLKKFPQIFTRQWLMLSSDVLRARITALPERMALLKDPDLTRPSFFDESCSNAKLIFYGFSHGIQIPSYGSATWKFEVGTLYYESRKLNPMSFWPTYLLEGLPAPQDSVSDRFRQDLESSISYMKADPFLEKAGRVCVLKQHFETKKCDVLHGLNYGVKGHAIYMMIRRPESTVSNESYEALASLLGTLHKDRESLNTADFYEKVSAFQKTSPFGIVVINTGFRGDISEEFHRVICDFDAGESAARIIFPEFEHFPDISFNGTQVLGDCAKQAEFLLRYDMRYRGVPVDVYETMLRNATDRLRAEVKALALDNNNARESVAFVEKHKGAVQARATMRQLLMKDIMKCAECVKEKKPTYLLRYKIAVHIENYSKLRHSDENLYRTDIVVAGAKETLDAWKDTLLREIMLHQHLFCSLFPQREGLGTTDPTSLRTQLVSKWDF